MLRVMCDQSILFYNSSLQPNNAIITTMNNSTESCREHRVTCIQLLYSY